MSVNKSSNHVLGYLFSYMAHGMQPRVETEKPSVTNSKQNKSQNKADEAFWVGVHILHICEIM